MRAIFRELFMKIISNNKRRIPQTGIVSRSTVDDRFTRVTVSGCASFMQILIKMRAIVFKLIYSERARHENSDRIQFFMNNELFRNLKKNVICHVILSPFRVLGILRHSKPK